MTWKRNNWILGLIILVVAVGVLELSWILWKPSMPVVRMPDGRVFMLCEVGYENKIIKRETHHWKILQFGFLAKYFSKVNDFNLPRTNFFRENVLSVYMGQQLSDFRQIKITSQSRVCLVDKNGYEYPGRLEMWEGYFFPPLGSSPLRNLVVRHFKNFPRRQKEILCRYYDVSGVNKVVEFMIPNPGYVPDAPVWEPETLPITKTNREVLVTLKGMELAKDGKSVRPLMDVVYPRGSYSVSNWLTDATGNIGDILSPSEKVWKLHVRLTRDKATPLPEDAVWRIPIRNCPPALSFTNINQCRSLDGILFHVTVLCGPGRLVMSNSLAMLPHDRRIPTNVDQVISYDHCQYSMTKIIKDLYYGYFNDRKSLVETYELSTPFFIIETSEIPDFGWVTSRFIDKAGIFHYLEDLHVLRNYDRVRRGFQVPPALIAINSATNVQGAITKEAESFFHPSCPGKLPYRYMCFSKEIGSGEFEISVDRPRDFEFLVKAVEVPDMSKK